MTSADLPATTWADGEFGDLLSLSTSTGEDGSVTVTATGEVDALTAPTFRVVLDSQLQRRPPELVIDLSGVRFLGSAGLTVLVEAHQEANDRGVALRLIATTRAVVGALTVTGLIDWFTVTGHESGQPTNRW
jgi:anti-sigma B factor antagonist